MDKPAIKTEKEVIIVSGSSGLIGTTLINELAKNYLVVGLDNVGYPFPPPTAECVCIDITSDSSMKHAFERIRFAYGNKIACVVHLAAYYDFSGEPSPLYQKITVEGTARLLKLLQDFEVEQFIFSSSLLVYKPTSPGIKITEDSPVEPKWDYPQSKVDTEKILHSQRGDIPVMNLRIAGVYSDKGHSIPIANHIQRINENQLTSHLYPGKFDHGNPYIHLDDLVGAILKAIEKRSNFSDETTINLGEPETMSFIELQQEIAQLLHNKEWKTYKIPKFVAKSGAWVQGIFGDPFIKPWMVDLTDDHMELDISRARKFLDWEPRHRLKTTLPRIIENLESDPLSWYKENNLEPPSAIKK
ncbi:NAD(P)-dependent oxidoreductase [Gramella sp. AN32]|uniref:NAD-dependent epimerase/dehydratase family protein n=1 Tax=Christiangramia antarctica TaxID=2058158 RepID=A0ABW5X5C2_9FLAO|nr:NAD(P)-dependent oxidoreductase [Gramella sp. AN32]MCM4156616.1 nucleoside-diphosphate sugar epimerase [Gramella sp. AN32]